MSDTGQPRVRLVTQGPDSQLEPNKDIRAYIAAARTPEPENSWTATPELPSPKEILGNDDCLDSGDVINLMVNQIRGPWPSTEMYLKAHYELLREDAVAPLRDSLAY